MVNDRSIFASHLGFDCDGFSTFGGIAKYNELHEVDFVSLIRKLNLQGARILDVGCGNGIFLEELLKIFPEMNVFGLDSKNYAHKIRNYIVADSRSIPLQTGSMDFVVSSRVSQWIVSQREKFYEEIFRVLSPQGKGLVFPCKVEDLSDNLSRRNYVPRTLYKGPNRMPVNQLVIGNIF
jgi:ubiquinone/menaquinone biosynthesis C-methylase UbiE